MLSFSILLAFSVLPHDLPLEVRYVDMIERNWVYDKEGPANLIFPQYIFWNYKGEHNEIQAWVLAKDAKQLTREPGRVTLLVVNFNGRYLIEARQFRESWTQYDVERHWRDNHADKTYEERQKRFMSAN